MAQNGQVIDENYLNQKIMYLNEERLRIHEMAQKYGLVNNVKVETLKLIETGSYDPNNPTESNNLSAIKDPKERI